MKITALMGIAVLAAASFSIHAAPDFPNKPIRILVGFSPGGSNDIIARLIAPGLSEILGQQVVVENRTGAAGGIAADAALKAQPDGHTVFMCTTGTLSIQPFLPLTMPFNIEDVAPVTQIANTPYLILVHSDLPVTNLKEFISYARSNPGTINFASSGNGSTAHLAGEMLKTRAGIDMVHVPYKGTGQALLDLTTGRVSLMFDQVVSSQPHVQAGKLKALAVADTERLPAMPNIPTTEELGLENFDPIPWAGLCASRHVPKQAIDTLQQAVSKVLAQPKLRERFAADSMQPVGSTAEEFATFLKADRKKWGGLVQDANIKPD